MEKIELGVRDAAIFKLSRHTDNRGEFFKVWSRKKFKKLGIPPCDVAVNLSVTKRKGTFRGLHYQIGPYAEAKILKCLKGTIFDVIIDLRKNSPTYKKWIGTELKADYGTLIYIPEGCAHGFLALEDDSVVEYQVSQYHNTDFESGIRFDDPDFNIQFPVEIDMVSDKDRSWPDFATQTNKL